MTPPPPPMAESAAPSPANDDWVDVPSVSDIVSNLGSAATARTIDTKGRRHSAHWHSLVLRAKAAWADQAQLRLSVKVFLISLATGLIVGHLAKVVVRCFSATILTAQFNPYAVLSIDDGTDLIGIKKAYRRLAIMYHPEKMVAFTDGQDPFKKVAMAFEVLTAHESCRNDYTQARCWESLPCVDILRWKIC